jgi:alkaline phosphatase D
VLTRRRFLGGSLATLAAACGRSPLIKTKQPVITHGVQSGDPQRGRVNVWARCDEPARMQVEWASTDQFTDAQRVVGPIVGPDTDFTGLAELTGLPDGQNVTYRVRFEREAARGASAWAVGRLATPRADRVRVAWTGDTCGQGFGRNPEWGGLQGYAAIRAARPDVLVHSGDLIYADNPIEATKPLPGGRVWRNLTNEHVGRVAETLADFRGRFAYNFEDDHVRALAADVPVIAQWDDHETHNNWWPGQQLDDARYRVQRDATVLSGYARRATFEWTPITPGPVHRVIHYSALVDVMVLDCRSFRTPNGANTGDDVMLGAAQVDWLAGALAKSTARWKIIACDQPIGLVIDDGPGRFEGFANGDPGAPSGREREIARLLGRLRDDRVRNCVWVTADVHYAAAHYFAGAAGLAYDPFWEFVAGPIHAGNFGPNAMDPSLGGEVKFTWGTPAAGVTDVAPWDGLQSFGTVDVTPHAATVTLWGIDNHERYHVDIPYAG